MDLGKSFTFTFEDENWLTKVLVGGLFGFLSMILIGIPFVLGYFLETLKNVATGQSRPLPNWGDDMGGLFKKGIVGTVGILIWALPIILFSCVFGIFLGALSGSSSSQSNSAIGLVELVSLCLYCLIGIYSLLLTVVLPAALIKFAVSDKLGDLFAFRDIFSFISKNLGNYIIAVLLSWVVSFVAGFGIILCFVGVLFTSFWSYLVMAHLFGQVYRAANPSS